jgi:hypothetical protein
MNDTRHVVVLQLVSFLAFTIGSSKGKTVQLPKPQQLTAWGLLTIILLVGVDLDTTAEVSMALAWLIFISVMLLYGVSLGNKLSTMVGGKEFA